MLVECGYCGHRWDSRALPSRAVTKRGRVSCPDCGNNTQDEAVKVWHGRLGKSFYDAYGVFKRFCEEALKNHALFGNMVPSELVEWQANARGRDIYKLKGLAQTWIDKNSWRYSTKQTRLSQISSFFLHNHAPWPPDPSFHFNSDIPPVEGRLDLESFKRIVLNSNKMYRAVFLFMAQTLSGEGELVYVNEKYCDLILECLTKNVGVVKLVLPGRKRNRNVKNYYTMFSSNSDCADALRDYLKGLPELPHDALFRNQQGKPLTRYNIQYYFHCRAVEAGVVKDFSPQCPHCKGKTVKTRNLNRIGYKCRECSHIAKASDFDTRFTHVRYGVNPHEIRDLIRTRWHLSRADPKVAEFMMEHDRQIDPNLYNKFWHYEPAYPLQEYRKALPWLNVLSNDPAKVDRSEAMLETEALRREVADLRRKLAVLDDPSVLEWLESLSNKKK